MITGGFFGKVPTLGDFVSRGWSNSARDGLDALLQEALQQVLTQSTEGKRAIMQAPPLMLCIRPGVIATDGLLTVVLPSQDRVGRLFPLCAGLQWNEAAPGWHMGWPSLEYGRALMAGLQRDLDAQATPESICDGIDGLGGPDRYAPTFSGPVGDETLPRLGSEVRWLRMCGPVGSMRSPNRALCAALADSSEMLGLVFDEAGEARDFIAFRRMNGGAPALASLFDGLWDERGWTTIGAPSAPADPGPGPLGNIDDDPTTPRQPRIDRVVRQPDSPGSA